MSWMRSRRAGRFATLLQGDLRRGHVALAYGFSFRRACRTDIDLKIQGFCRDRHGQVKWLRVVGGRFEAGHVGQRVGYGPNVGKVERIDTQAVLRVALTGISTGRWANNSDPVREGVCTDLYI